MSRRDEMWEAKRNKFMGAPQGNESSAQSLMYGEPERKPQRVEGGFLILRIPFQSNIKYFQNDFEKYALLVQ